MLEAISIGSMADGWDCRTVSVVVGDAFADFLGERTFSVLVVGRDRKEVGVVRFEILHGVRRGLPDPEWRARVVILAG